MKNREIVVAVTGGIAAYKAAALVSQLVQGGAGVTVAMTDAAERFVGPTTFAALTGRAVAKDLFSERHPLGAHIELAAKAEVLCVAPATANFLAKAAAGVADDLVSTLYLCFAGSVLVAPAMNTQMWAHPAVRRNVDQLRADGVTLIDPEEGWLSCRDTGAGRMAAPESILAAIKTAFDAMS